MVIKALIFLIRIYQSLLDYNMLKVISEQLRLLSWASPAAWLWVDWQTTNKPKTTFVIILLWLWWQSLALIIFKLAQKFKGKEVVMHPRI
jgi:hypothetical protein